MSSHNAIKKFLFKLLILSVLFFALDRGLSTVLKTGLDKYYGFGRGAKLLCIGHSHTMLGIDGAKLEQGLGIPVAKYAMNGANPSDRLTMIKHYFGSHPDRPRLVIYDVNSRIFASKELSSNSYRLLFPYLDNPDVDCYVRGNAGAWDEYLSRRLVRLLRYNGVTINLALRGTIGNHGNFKSGRIDIPTLQKEITTGGRGPVTVDLEMLNAFRETVRLVRDNGVTLVLFYIPTVDLLNNVDKKGYEDVMHIFREYALKDKSIIFLDYNPQFSHRHELFSDPIHLNRRGQQAVTEQAVVDLKKIPATE